MMVNILVQIEGISVMRLDVPVDASSCEIQHLLMKEVHILKNLVGKTVQKVVYIKNVLANILLKEREEDGVPKDVSP